VGGRPGEAGDAVAAAQQVGLLRLRLDGRPRHGARPGCLGPAQLHDVVHRAHPSRATARPAVCRAGRSVRLGAYDSGALVYVHSVMRPSQVRT
jgi:hypothetical protein